MRQSTVVGVSTLLFSLAAGREALAQAASPCSSVREHSRDTVVVFQPPSTFTICRNGLVETGVVTDRSVFLELAPTPGPPMFEFRVHGRASDWTPMGLGAWEALASRLAAELRDLDHSGEPIAQLPLTPDPGGTPATPLRPLINARTRYLAEVTPQYTEALHKVRSESRELPVVAGVVRRWCASLGSEPPGVVAAEAELKATCAAPELREGAVEQLLTQFEAAAHKESVERGRVREAALSAVAHPDDGKAVADAVRAFDDARLAANAVVAAGHALREPASVLARSVGTLRAAVRSVNAIRPGVPTYLSTYSTSGNAELEIDASPIDIAALGTDGAHSTGKATASFPIFGRHYLDIEAGIGFGGGITGSPYVSTVQGQKILQTQPVTALAGLALAELEPLRFFLPERALAGVLRLPVVGIPFTRDPTANFFFGAGLGWTGVGSLSAGPYLLRETTLRNGFSINEALPSGVPFSSVTVPGVRVGYFISASIDLVGLFHLFVPTKARTIDALTGKEK